MQTAAQLVPESDIFKAAHDTKKICNATNGRLPGGRNTEGNLRGFTVVMCCDSVGVIMHVLSSETGKT